MDESSKEKELGNEHSSNQTGDKSFVTSSYEMVNQNIEHSLSVNQTNEIGTNLSSKIDDISINHSIDKSNESAEPSSSHKNHVNYPVTSLPIDDKLNNCSFEWDTFEDNTSSESIPSNDEWQDLTKSDYAKVIFCDLYHHVHSGGVGCKFQITDNVHEDPCDYVGLFRVGYDNLNQCLVSKMLSQTECEEDGKLLRCIFTSAELPDIEDGFYQFLYVTRDKEICGASMPFEIKQAKSKHHSSDDEVIAEKVDDDFLMVRTGFEQKKILLEKMVIHLTDKTEHLNSTIKTLMLENQQEAKERHDIVDFLNKEITSLKQTILEKAVAVKEKDVNINCMLQEIACLNKTIKSQNTTIHKKDMCISCKDQLIIKERKKQMQLEKENQDLTKLLRSLEQRVQEKEKFSIDQEKFLMMEQLENQRVMIKVLEDGKELAIKEMSNLSASLSKQTSKCKEQSSQLNEVNKKLFQTIESNSLLKKKLDLICDQFCEAVKESLKVLNGIKQDPKCFQDEDKKSIYELRHALKEKRCEKLAIGGKIADVTSLLKTALENNCLKCETHEVGPFKAERKCLKTLHQSDLQNSTNVEMADLEYMNRLTEKINQRNHDVLLQVKPVPGKDTNTNLKDAMLCMERIIVAVKNHLVNNGSWSSVIDGYNMEYVELPKELQIEAVLSECRKQYQIEILLEFLGQSEENVQELAKSFSELQSLIPELEAKDIENQSNLTERENKIIRLSNEISDLQSRNTELEKEIFNLKATCTEHQSNLSKTKDIIIQLHKSVLQLDTEKSDHQVNCSVKDQEICDLKAKCTELQAIIMEKDSEILKLNDDCLKKQALIEYVMAEKDAHVKKESALEEIVSDYITRIKEAAELYKVQFLEIEKLKKKLKKVTHFYVSSSRSSSITSETFQEVHSDDYFKVNLSRIPEKLQPHRNSSDSDTGERVLGNSVMQLAEVKPDSENSSNVPGPILEKLGRHGTSVKKISPGIYEAHASIKEFEECVTPAHASQCETNIQCQIPQLTAVNTIAEVSSSHDSNQESWQKIISEKLGGSKEGSLIVNQAAGNTDELYQFPCLLCSENIMVSVKSISSLLRTWFQHLDKHHQLNMCLICGEVFPSSIPRMCVILHITDHFRSK